MKVLFLDAYYEPEKIAFSHLEKDLIEKLVELGSEIEIVCPIPTRGLSRELKKKYKKIHYESCYDGKVNITRFWAPQEKRNPIIRAIRYFWCNIRSYQVGKNIKNIDVVFSNSTPPTQGYIAGLVAKKLRVPFVFSLQDIFPDSLITTGLIKRKSLLWKIGRKIEDKTYKKCQKIIVISESMKNNLLRKKVNDNKIIVVSNWIDLEKIYPINKKDNGLYDEYGIPKDKFLIVYAGNFGAAQGADIIIDVAEELVEDTDIQFVIFGGGPDYKKIEDKSKKLKNVIINPLLPQSRVSEVYSLGDIVRPGA